MERSKQKGFPTVHAFNTFFFTKLKTASYQAVKRWTKKVDIFSVDILLVPIHLGVHWCLAVSMGFYMYVCMCVCLCMCIYLLKHLSPLHSTKQLAKIANCVPASQIKITMKVYQM